MFHSHAEAAPKLKDPTAKAKAASKAKAKQKAATNRSKTGAAKAKPKVEKAAKLKVAAKSGVKKGKVLKRPSAPIVEAGTRGGDEQNEDQEAHEELPADEKSESVPATAMKRPAAAEGKKKVNKGVVAVILQVEPLITVAAA